MELIFSAFKKFQIMGKSLRTKLIKKENKKTDFYFKNKNGYRSRI